MRWSIIRVIWLREMRDQLRDRRTVLMVVVLPLLMYPLLGFGVLQLAYGLLLKKNVAGVYGSQYLPGTPTSLPRTPAQVASWLGAGGVGQAGPLFGAAAQSHLENLIHGSGYPPLFRVQGDTGRFLACYGSSPRDTESLPIRFFPHVTTTTLPEAPDLEGVDLGVLENKEVDVLLILPRDFQARLDQGDCPVVRLVSRVGEERSRSVAARVQGYLGQWKKRIKEVRLLRHNLPANFDDPFEIVNPEQSKPVATRMAEGLFEMLVRVFPFMLVMWSLAGALYPAVDLCAGEKERGTMETLLISPTSREEIVLGKFLAIWVFSVVTALLNLASLGLSTLPFRDLIPQELSAGPMVWCVLLVLPLSAFFSATCLALGAYARSSKEGQYYLMPLFLLCLPLVFLTLAPGVELNAFYSTVPVTGVALLLQRLMTVSSPEQIPWAYFVPVLGTLLVYSWLALRWAVEQFKREEVLFREAERLDLILWIRRLFREPPALPSAAMAVTCFVLVVILRWVSFGLTPTLVPLGRRVSGLAALMVIPPLAMGWFLTRKPTESLGLRRPSAWAVLSALALAVLLFPPLIETALWVFNQFPDLKDQLRERHSLTEAVEHLRGQATGGISISTLGWYFIILGVLPAVCEELAFRGFILNGLLRRFRPFGAILFSSFLFALAHMNVFQLLPSFLLGLVLGLLAVRSGSVLPSMAFHLMHNSLLLSLVYLTTQEYAISNFVSTPLIRFEATTLGLLVAGFVLWQMSRVSGKWTRFPFPRKPPNGGHPRQTTDQ